MTVRTVDKGAFLRRLRKLHGWLGLWGAALGLLFGITGFLLNHRQVMKIPAMQMHESQFQLAIQQPVPPDPQAFGRWAQQGLHLRHAPYKAGVESPKPVIWQGVTVPQPVRLKAEFHLPQVSYTTEYVMGNSFVSVRQQEVNTLGLLMRLHKGVGMNTGWVLLIDSLAGAMVTLSITGILLWTRMRRSRLTLAGLGLGSMGLAVFFALQSM